MTTDNTNNVELTDDEMLRYNRQIILRQFDFDGQEALKASSMLVLGAGGLGCASTQYLAAAGVGKLTLIDDDKVEVSNLQRQVLHHDATVGMLKVDSAKAALCRINPYISSVDTIAKRLSDEELLPLIESHNIVLDCSDNVDTRNQLNRLCFKTKTPLISGAAIRMEGQISVYAYQDNEPCYQCLSALFGQQTLSCVEAGIMSPVVGIVGAVQAMEAIKVVANMGTPLTGKLLMLDALSMSWREMKLMKQPNCSVCAN
ncbi:molybdopterin-synthase adenylyltransferase MoeB [Photobacterium leiognathi]|uniref:molybdopterin-synthase adenylyltransferase MoeB n=1 Tax=Photobacterium leiognathi TaxID=553611 RepID=UPI0029821CEC|nr:molybdopterin-synthase adenylyltransferase MoeB [Photobacterium leiognathi]